MVELHRYRVRPAGSTDPDHEFEIESRDAPSAAAALARLLSETSNKARHRDRKVEVRQGGVWVPYICRYSKVTVHRYDATTTE